MRLLEAVETDGEGEERWTLLPENWRTALSFPEQNDKLLIALRRYQSRISRLHRWWLVPAGRPPGSRTPPSRKLMSATTGGWYHPS
jgi:hypothetical protein